MPVSYTRHVQRTLREPVAYTSAGTRRATVLIRPGAPDTGIRFVRWDPPGGVQTLPVRIEYVGTDGANATLQSPGGAEVRGVGPVLVGLAACGIDNAEIALDGDEAVLPPGGGAALVDALERAGAEEQARPLRVIKIERSLTVADGARSAILRPSTVPHAAISLEAADGSGRRRWLAVGLGEEMLRELIRSLAGDAKQSAGSESLRRMLLECVGYLVAAGAPIVGHFLAQNPDHELMRNLVRALAGQQGSWSLVTVSAPST